MVSVRVGRPLLDSAPSRKQDAVVIVTSRITLSLLGLSLVGRVSGQQQRPSASLAHAARSVGSLLQQAVRQLLTR